MCYTSLAACRNVPRSDRYIGPATFTPLSPYGTFFLRQKFSSLLIKMLCRAIPPPFFGTVMVVDEYFSWQQSSHAHKALPGMTCKHYYCDIWQEMHDWWDIRIEWNRPWTVLDTAVGVESMRITRYMILAKPTLPPHLLSIPRRGSFDM